MKRWSQRETRPLSWVRHDLAKFREIQEWDDESTQSLLKLCSDVGISTDLSREIEAGDKNAYNCKRLVNYLSKFF